jgi:ribosomal protein S18 acetylase RimI-like enzyme
VVNIVPYDAKRHQEGVREVLEKSGWEERYIAGQLASLAILSANLVSGTRGEVYVFESKGRLGGFVSVEFREWNRLGQLHGLAVEPSLKRRGIASALVRRADVFVREEEGRGIYVDTPVTNRIACSFYRALGYRRAYTMPEYYDEGLDGITYLKLFPR